MHLNLAAGLATRFEPGDERSVELVGYGGNRRAVGFNNLVDDSTVTAGGRRAALRRLAAWTDDTGEVQHD